MKLNLPIYLDYQATTPLDPRVGAAMAPYWSESFGNPHSQGHSFGWEASRAVNFARSQVANLIGADDEEVTFASGATESCNLAIRGAAYSPSGRNRIITAATEHPAVLETVSSLGRFGFDPVILPVQPDGLLNLDVLAEHLNENTLLVSVMLANNEIGVIQPVDAIAEMAREVGALTHTDATQAVGRMDVDVDALGVDLLSMSGHKIYGPNGVGALYARHGVRLEPLMTGGSQEGGLRPGTVPVPIVVGFGEACDIVVKERNEESRRILEMTTRLRKSLMSAVSDLALFGHPTQRIPGNLCLGVPGVPAEQVVEAASDKIAISTGAACSTGSPEPSHVLTALGLDEETASSAARISLGRYTTDEEINLATDTLGGIWNLLGGWQ